MYRLCNFCSNKLDPQWGYVVIGDRPGCLDCFAERNGSGLMYAILKEVQRGKTEKTTNL